MAQELATQQAGVLGNISVTNEQVELIKNTVANGATDDELKLFFFECRRRGVHPLDRLIHFVKRQGKVAFQCGIDFLRSQSEETGEYRGMKDIEYGPMIDFTEGKKVPEFAKATVLRYDPITNQIIEVSAVAFWDEYYPGEAQGFNWRKMPRHMLGKCAEALAHRKAFPRKLAGLYTFEEMQLTDLVDQGKRKSKTDSVKPGNGTTETKQETGKTLTAAETLRKELSKYCGNDETKMADILKGITFFDGQDGPVFMTLEGIEKAKSGWLGKTISALRKYIKDNPLETDCNPKDCGQSTMHDADVWCEKEEKNCKRVA